MAPKDILTKEYLEEHFVRLCKSEQEIARELGISSHNSVRQYIQKFGLSRSPIRTSSKILTKEYLEEHYVRQQKGMRTIAAELGIKNRAVISARLKKFGIPIRKDFVVTQAFARFWDKVDRPCGEISKRYWNSIIHMAREREIEFDLDIREAWSVFLKQDQKCAMTGENIRFKKPGEQASAQTASLDRIDSSRGYSLDNIQWIHKRVQKMKWAFAEREFILTCRQIANYRSEVA